MNFGPYDLFVDFAVMSVLLFFAQLIRAKVKFIQNLYLPAPLIAGFIGLFLGKYFLNILPFSSQISSYAYLLIVILMGSLFLGKKEKRSFKETFNRVGDTFAMNMGVELGQFGFCMLVGTFVIKRLFPEVNEAFSILLPAGFVGGHGYAAAIGGTLKDMAGWEEALTIGQTFATAGLLAGVIGGLSLINFATRKKATRLIKTMAELPENMRTGLVKPKDREIMGENTTNPMSIDPLTWHILLILFAAGIGYGIDVVWKMYVPKITLPLMCLSMFGSVIVQKITEIVKVDNYVDKRIITRASSTVTDYLVGFGIASMNIEVVIEYAMPIIVMLILGMTYCLFYLFFISRKLFHNFWFERGIFIYGWSTGVVAMGVTLLRVVDPELESGTLEDFGIAYAFVSIVEVFIVALTPIAMITGNAYLGGGVLLAALAALVGITIKKYGIKNDKMSDLRPGEAEIIDRKVKVNS